MKKIGLLFAVLSAFIANPAFAQEYKIENNEVKIQAGVKFKTGTAELLPGSDAALLLIKKYLEDKTYITLLRVEAHTDNSGDAETNQLLSEKRAVVVCQKLITMGVACSRLLPVGFGGNKPVMSNDSPEGRSQNMRVGFFNAAMRGKAIGGMATDGGGKVAEDPCY